MFTKRILTLASALLAKEALALNAHRHAHQVAHNKKDVVYAHTSYTTMTEWVTTTVYDDDLPESTASMFKGSRPESYAPVSESPSPAAPQPTPEASPSTSAVPVAAAPVPDPTTLVPQVSQQAQVVAPEPPVASAPATPPPSSGTGGGGKRGLAYNAGNLLKGFTGGGPVTWTYNWGQSRDGGDNTGLEFVPMLWSPAHESGWDSNAERAISNGAKALLSFNECDNPGQAAMDAGSAAAAHIRLMNKYQGRARIGSPAITNSNNPGEGIQWLQNWKSACGGQCAFDFCAVHWYSPADAQGFLDHMEAAHAACGAPIWITEFAPFGSESEISNFLSTVMKAMDTDPRYNFIERYAYFYVAEGSLVTGGSPNPLGKLFAGLS